MKTILEKLAELQSLVEVNLFTSSLLVDSEGQKIHRLFCEITDDIEAHIVAEA